MSSIANAHVEWAVVERLRIMIEEPPHRDFNVTQAYSLFTSILCWVMQHIRMGSHETQTRGDRNARRLLVDLRRDSITDDPWRVHTSDRLVPVGARRVHVPAPRGFDTHTVERLLINLRDATAHGDARNVKPFNEDALLAGFTFACAEFRRENSGLRRVWDGKITLLEDDMRRIGSQLARRYCDAVRHSNGGDFEHYAASIKEITGRAM